MIKEANFFLDFSKLINAREPQYLALFFHHSFCRVKIYLALILTVANILLIL